MRRLLALGALLVAVALVVAGTAGVVYGAFLGSQSGCAGPRLAVEAVDGSDVDGGGDGDAGGDAGDPTPFDALDESQRTAFRDALDGSVAVTHSVADSFPDRVRYEGTTYRASVAAGTCNDPGIVFKVAGLVGIVSGIVLAVIAGALWLRWE